ncbi:MULTISPECIES: CCA tRNA nucleotidyltransferase [unclassified Pseudovibrio]|uniref:CCA tRNA nucleotidyltransferase n=1 Tax=unclassified Pseudovibrio TaxID=2627060 RepID=UPI0007AEA1B2|nr:MULTISPECIES: CCA tRNA nucleotidyltransferase [unclassified Pseudovibrio]KZL03114.1 CCA-adding enzyme [Pseudovibrio sp. W74]KZL04867.1 CCA-adding enzyme [Pseudovibrio sp. Ad14]
MTRLQQSGWLDSAAVQRAFDVLEQDGDVARAVGGTVRNSLLGEVVDDVDIACTALPDVVLARAEAAGVKAIPTGVDHGTVTLVIDRQPIEVTCLREDIETHGRHATVKFGRDWTKDAQRRDFTMNALYVDRHGELFDPLGGLDDCLNRHLRFIGDARARIREDYLRILRFFRFFATYGQGEINADGYAACLELKDGLSHLSKERITKEVLRTLSAPRALDSLLLMEQGGILQLILGGEAASSRLARLLDLEDLPEAALQPVLRLGGVAGPKVAECLRLSNAQKKQIEVAADIAEALRLHGQSKQQLKALLVAHGTDAIVDGVLTAWMSDIVQSEAELKELLAFAQNWVIPNFPLTGKMMLAGGIPAGPDMGKAMRLAQQIWADADYQQSAESLLEQVKVLLADEVK